MGKGEGKGGTEREGGMGWERGREGVGKGEGKGGRERERDNRKGEQINWKRNYVLIVMYHLSVSPGSI